jgi:H+/Cl- antiporter ClcA
VERARYAVFGFIGGAAAGLLVWSTQVERSRRELFNRSPVRRFAALGFLSGQPGLETTRLLADYVNWETRPALRRRGQLLLRRMEAHLD